MAIATVLPKIMLPQDSKMLAPFYSSGPSVLHANYSGVGSCTLLFIMNKCSLTLEMTKQKQ